MSMIETPTLQPYSFYDNVVYVALTTWIVHEVLWILANAPYLYIEKYGLYKDRLLQPRARRAPWTEIAREVPRLLIGHVLLVFPAAILIAMATGGRYIVVENKYLPPFRLLAAQLIIGALVRDVLAYVVHRAFHIPFLYKHIHSIHHKNAAPYSLAGEHMHWAETILHAMAPMTVGMVFSAFCTKWMYGVVPHVHIIVVWILLFNAQWRDVENHCGHDLPWMQFWSTWMKWYDGGVYHHDPHHAGYDYNFSTYWIDWLFGTTKDQYMLKRAQRIDRQAAGTGSTSSPSPSPSPSPASPTITNGTSGTPTNGTTATHTNDTADRPHAS